MKIVTTAFPFVPVELGIHHLASTYIPADIFVRALRMLKKDVVFVSATDFHSVYASHNGIQDHELCEKMHNSYLKCYEKMHIRYDYVITTDDPLHFKEARKAIKNLNKDNLIYEKDSQWIHCNTCNTYLPNSFVKKNEQGDSCILCGKSNLSFGSSKHAWLQITKCYEIIRKYTEKFTQKDVKKIADHFLENLSDWDFTRQNKFGIPYNESLTLYLWFESLVGYFTLTSNINLPNFDYVHFLGKNIVYYHSVVWPVILHSLSEHKNNSFDLSVRGFMKGDSQINLSVEDLCSKYNPDILRLYCAFKVKDTIQDFSLNELEISIFKDKFKRGPLNFINRCIGLLNKIECEYVVPCDEEYKDHINSLFIKDIAECYCKHRINSALRKTFKLIDYAQKELTKMINDDNIIPGRLCFLSIAIATLLSPVVPNISKEILICSHESSELFLDEINSFTNSNLKKKAIHIC